MPSIAPIALSEAQMAAVFAAAHTVPGPLRSAFLSECAHTLAGLPVLGDGLAHRVIIQIRRRYLQGGGPRRRDAIEPAAGGYVRYPAQPNKRASGLLWGSRQEHNRRSGRFSVI